MSELDAMLARLKGLARAGELLAAEAAPRVRAALEAGIMAQRSPEGQRWLPGREGQSVLTGAGKALSVNAVGDVVTARLEGPEARHHFGIVKGGERRGILPQKGVPPVIAEALQEASAAVAAKVLGA